MLISVIGKQRRVLLISGDHHESGFTLIEILVAISVVAIMMSVAILSTPNHDERHWRNDLDHLVGSLNAAQDESAMSGNMIFVQLDAQGWRFHQSNPISSSAISLSIGSAGSQLGSSVLLPDAYKPQLWNKAVVMEPIQLTLGGEFVVGVLNIPLSQDARRAVISRNRNGRFNWVKG